MAITPKIENDILKDGVTNRQYSIEAVGSGMSTITEDMSVLDTVGTRATAELITNVGIITCEHSKTGTVHNILSENESLYNIRFTATADYATGDTFTVNGTVATFNGTPNFKIGDVVSCMLEGSKLTFATVPDVMGVLIENGFKGDTLPTITRISNVLENGFYVCNGSSGTAGTPTNSWYIVQVVRNGNWVRIIARQGWEVQNIYEKYRSADGASDSGWYKYTLTKV